MVIFVFSTKKPVGIAANMNEKLRNVDLVAGLHVILTLHVYLQEGFHCPSRQFVIFVHNFNDDIAHFLLTLVDEL